MSIKLKIAFLFTLLVTIILAIASFSVYLFSVQERENSFNRTLHNRAVHIARVYASIEDSNLSERKVIDQSALATLKNKTISVYGLDGGVIYNYSDIPGDTVSVEKEMFENVSSDAKHFFNYKSRKAVAIFSPRQHQSFIVAIAAADEISSEYLYQLKRILLIAMLAAGVLSFFTGLLFAINLIRPIKKLTGEVNRISLNNLAQRIETNNTRDELNKLAQTFNELMDRLQDSFALQRRFISNASHELSTPLTSISSQLEVALQRSRTEAEYKDVMQSVYEDIQELQQLTRSLLDIAKTGSHGSIDLSNVRVDEVLFKVASDVQKQNAAYKTNLSFETFPEDENLLTSFGNANLLYIAFKNIVDNGCKYADNHQSDIAVWFNSQSIVVQVTNIGDIIAEADIEDVFQPFFRTGSAINKPGFGLGLTLTRRILALHKGSVSVQSTVDKGTVFTITLHNILHPHQV